MTEEFFALFKELKSNRSLSDEEAAGLFGYSRSWVSKIRAGKLRPSKKAISVMRKALREEEMKLCKQKRNIALLGERLRRQRVKNGLSQNELGLAIGRTGASISDWEKDRYSPSLEDMIRVSDILDCDPAYLTFGSRRSTILSDALNRFVALAKDKKFQSKLSEYKYLMVILKSIK